MALHEALSQFPRTFPPVYRALIQAGEVAGNLGPTLRRLGDDLAARRALAEDIRNAFLYPLFLFVAATVGIMVLLLIVVPNLESLIGEEGKERLSAVTRQVLATSHIVRDYGFVLIAAAATSAILISLLIMAPAGRAYLDRFILKAPLLGSLVKIIETGRFARTLGALLSGGVAVSPAMRIASDTVANRRMRSGLTQAHKSIISGVAIGDAIAASGVFEDDAIGLIRVGEKTGRLAGVLERMATLHEARAARQLKALTVMLTPVMTIVFGALAGAIVYAMLSTILGINELASL
jgi:type II secretory pathway component PulF